MRKCETCGKPLPPDAHWARRYCDDECHQPAIQERKKGDKRGAPNILHTYCVICGDPIPEGRHPTRSTCSDECDLARRRRYKRTRRHEMRKDPEGYKRKQEQRNVQRRAHRAAHPLAKKPKRKKLKKPDPKPKWKKLRHCIMCGGELPPDRHPKTSTCSDECRLLRKRQVAREWAAKQAKKERAMTAVAKPKPMPPCVVCGKRVPVPPKSRKPRKTCSDACLQGRYKAHRKDLNERHSVAIGKPKPKPKPKPAAASDPSRITHKKFGEGTIVETLGTLERIKHRVLFDDPDYGEKLIVAGFLDPA